MAHASTEWPDICKTWRITQKEQSIGVQTTRRFRFEGACTQFGAATFGGGNEFFRAWGSTDLQEARRLIDICLEADVNLFDTADVYSDGLSEEILGSAISGRRDNLLISTKATFPMGDGPNDLGSSRYHLVRACEASLRRLNTDYIDVYTLHGFQDLTPVEEALGTLDDLVQSGKVRYIACSNFSGWHLM